MVSKIRILDEQTVNRIAAGEVIEDPSSVIKELIDNALDAKSSSITLETLGGGRQLIRVIDDGEGMSGDDALLCFERHATSKIGEDISYLVYMGFRGEAIPSIASISKFTLMTRARGEPEGTLIVVEGGKFIHHEKAALSEGTTVEVKSLFYNVPVRKKFQRSPTSDTAATHRMLSALALGNPHVAFKWINNQKQVVSYSPWLEDSFSDSLAARVQDVLGATFLTETFPAVYSESEIELTGFFGAPTFTRNNRSGQYLFINRRPVFSPMISKMICEAYGTHLPPRCFPVFVLHLNLPTHVVDVNVHPQKKEVRLRQFGKIREILCRVIAQGLSKGSRKIEPSPTVKPLFMVSPSFVPTGRDFRDEEVPFFIPEVMFKPTQLMAMDSQITPKVLTTIRGYILVDPETLPEDSNSKDSGLVLIDQQRAFASVVFHQLEQCRESMPIQSLLIPLTLSFSKDETYALSEHLLQFTELGIHLRKSEGEAFLLDAFPQCLETVDFTALVREIVQEFLQEGCSKGVRSEFAKLIALRAAQRASCLNKIMDLREAEILVRRLFKTRSPYFSPAGKRTLCYLNREHLATMMDL